MQSGAFSNKQEGVENARRKFPTLPILTLFCQSITSQIYETKSVKTTDNIMMLEA